MALLELHDHGLYCPQADIYIDPWKPVDKAVITHAHADHARWGMKNYLAHHQSEGIMRYRLGQDIRLQTLPYGEAISVNGVKVSLHPAGHIPGSAQVRFSYKGEVAVVTGDFKTESDGVSTPFEPLRCDLLVSECTFGLPIYRWENQAKVMDKINVWWANNAAAGRCSVLFTYALGKAQRIHHHLDPNTGPVYLHGAIWNTHQALSSDGFIFPEAKKVSQDLPKSVYRNALIIAPPSAAGTPWMKKFSPYRTGICSGWMQVRGARRRRAADVGFVVSDHADWPGLNAVVQASGAGEVFLTHGYTDSFARHLCEQGINAKVLETLFMGDSADGDAAE
ncbi:ligase-associated DNA damage response exonuclease [Pleomorphovibrio marinus]|uniref:ligase-associated DNA damage response exonuclease n=1 Tax=Pleomorphovibrio marinus TaxID=2164132 RepID=UPI000E0CB8A0|nr:ligase-associated DNA damage response exonuclease [Pleomorphovibrio marinus]